ncbi:MULTISPECIES: 3-oxoacid CoA-transferase subunit A [Brucella/Ochrobactrum group]|jgi:3-oxoadipate CoA-transferase alpha subunit|uniref:3-oxoacid CoA-transferase subunit A n=1 Tax=Brucella pseudintermedia TaxID=370111 RepID=A0ABY5UFV2_9HYPH|nr:MULTISPECIES: 3-oxoacid CoA-transferase subunit A [Brucella/Ochrobactrum group]KAB2684511.1 3-oxoacid CoA-transferase subunit A [Brucella pseudintermedia]MCO7727853.1 3-oxoacid CoA-transferase subunit A [Brucella intermedia]NKE74795.1 3-oxoacid CoA-transferase subunit A [Ochrobactrum sp. MC-1LL]TWG97726.1 3-oxoadipate CoA-transferase alpha subunit [Ochrobactrum sp. J50]UWL62216.1 3-oxoacid CoA-transferase subunit A [Brucella pseudintermedia]
MDKTIGSLADAVAGINDGTTVMIGGFGGSGAPIELIHALIDKGSKNLTVINNNAGNGSIGIAAMIEAGMVRKMICSFPRSSDPRAFTEKYMAGDIELELVPQGTLAERIRAGGAGIPAFYTPTAYGTELAEGKAIAEFDGRPYVQERWLKADFALIKAHLGDKHGNLTYRMAARNFNPLMCMAAAKTIVQVSQIVPLGGIEPENVITPGIFVDSLVEVANPKQEEELIRAGVTYA